MRTATPVLAARQSDPDAGQQDLTTTFTWWRIDGTPGGAGQASQSSGNPSPVSAAIPAGLLADGGTYAWRARTFDGTRYGPWSARCEFSVDATAPEAPAGVTSTDYPADGPHGGPVCPESSSSVRRGCDPRRSSRTPGPLTAGSARRAPTPFRPTRAPMGRR